MTGSVSSSIIASHNKLGRTAATRVSARHVLSARCSLHTPLRRALAGHRHILRPCAANKADQDELTPYEKKVLEKRRQIQAEYSGDPQAYVSRRNRERDLYSDQWDGDKWKGSKLNGLTVITVISILAPVIGLLVAYFTYGSLWG